MNLGPLSIVNKGQHVKYFLRNGMVLEGTIEEDAASKVILRSLDGQSLMILHRPTEDILMTKVILGGETSEISEEPTIKPGPTELQSQIKHKLEETQQIEDPELQKMSIEELRQLVHEQERQIIANKKREHFGNAGAAKQAVRYSSPYSLTAYSPRHGQKTIAEKASNQEAEILRKNFSRKR